MPDTLSGGGSSVSCPYDVADQNWEGQNRGGCVRSPDAGMGDICALMF